MKVNRTVFYIVSAHLDHNTPAGNAYNHQLLVVQAEQRGLDYKEVFGRYKQAESSIVIFNDKDAALELANTFAQEVVVEVNRDSSAYMVDPKTGDDYYAGMFKTVPHWREPALLESNDPYVYDVAADTYFVIGSAC